MRCQVTHRIPEKGFFPNKSIERLIDMEVTRINLGADYSLAKVTCNEFADMLMYARRMTRDCKEWIREKIRELKNRADLRREELKKKIDEETLEVINELELYEKKCITQASSSNSDAFAAKLNDWERDLQQCQLELTKFNENKTWQHIEYKICPMFIQLNAESAHFEKCLFLKRFRLYKNRHMCIGSDFNLLKYDSLTSR